MSVQTYYSTDVSAPTLTGQVGSLTSLLKACLVDGYGSRSSLGWSVIGPTNNKAAFRPPTGSRFHLWIDDNASDTGLAKNANCRGWESLTTLDANGDPTDGVDGFPTVADKAKGHWWLKSNSADSSTREWALIGDESGFYFGHLQSSSIGWDWNYFGDFESFASGDVYNCVLHAAGANPGTSPTYPYSYNQFWYTPNTASAGAVNGIASPLVARDYAGTKAQLAGKWVVISGWGGNKEDSIYDPVRNGFKMTRVMLGTGNGANAVHAGYWPGLWAPVNMWRNFCSHKSKVQVDLGESITRTFQVFNINTNIGTGDGNCGRICLDITGPWR